MSSASSIILEYSNVDESGLGTNSKTKAVKLEMSVTSDARKTAKNKEKVSSNDSVSSGGPAVPVFLSCVSIAAVLS
jgi:hypothetical protein